MWLGLYCAILCEWVWKLKESLSFPAVGWSRLLYSVLTWISKLCLDSLLRLLRARASLVEHVCFLLIWGCSNGSFVWCCYLFWLAAAQFSVVWLDNGVTLRFGFSCNVTWVWSFSRYGVNRRLHVATYVYFSLGGLQPGPNKVVEGINSYAYLKY
jgi:hypothetical protein